MSFMTPPNPSNLSTLKNRGAKMMVYHGTADPIFSSDDTTAWYDKLATANAGDASNFARYYPVPGMNHCSGGPATDSFDSIQAMVDWVEKGIAPDTIAARALPSSADFPQRTRPLCPYPKIARYRFEGAAAGTGNVEDAASFVCALP